MHLSPDLRRELFEVLLEALRHLARGLVVALAVAPRAAWVEKPALHVWAAHGHAQAELRVDAHLALLQAAVEGGVEEGAGGTQRHASADAVATAGPAGVDEPAAGLVALDLLAHAPDKLHEEVSADYQDMIYAATVKEVEQRRKAFLRKWRLKCRAVADSLEEAGERLFTFTRLPTSQWKSARTTNAIERLHEEFKRRIKTQTVLPAAETAAMLFWALLASGQITMRKVDGWQSLAEPATTLPIDLAA